MESSAPPVDPNASEVSSVIAAAAVSIVISGFFFAARILSRRLQRTKIQAADWILLVALLCCWGFCILNLYFIQLGLGRHMAVVAKEDPTLANVKLMLKVFIVEEVFYDVGLSAVKISILLLYMRVFPGKPFSIVLSVMMGIVVAWCIGNLMPSIFSCRPINGFWDFDMQPPPVCIDKTKLYVSGSVINIVTDVAILVLPITKVAKLQLHRRAKIGIIVVFLLGGLVCVVSAYRFTVLFNSNSPDITWSFAPVLNWSVVELATAVASASLPTLRPLLRAMTPKSWRGSSGHASSAPDARSGDQYGRRSRYNSRLIGAGGFERLTGGENNKSQQQQQQQHQRTISEEAVGIAISDMTDVETGSSADITGKEGSIMVTKTFEMTTMKRPSEDENK